MPGDIIFVYENTMYDNLLSISVIGEVNKRGRYQLKLGMTVKDAIDAAEGFSPLANENGIIVTNVFSYTDNFGNQVKEEDQVKDANLNFELTDGAIINVLPVSYTHLRAHET